MLFFNIKNKMFTEKRYTAKRTEETLEPMNLNALNTYVKRIENKKQHMDLLSRIFSGHITTEAANTATTERKAINS